MIVQVYTTVLDGKPLGPSVMLRSEEWQETGGTSAESAALPNVGKQAATKYMRETFDGFDVKERERIRMLWKIGLPNVVLAVLLLLLTPIFITHILPGMVSRQRVHSCSRN